MAQLVETTVAECSLTVPCELAEKTVAKTQVPCELISG